MKVWVMQGSYEGDMFCSVHFTEKGAALAALADVLDFLSVTDRASAIEVLNDQKADYSDTPKEYKEPIEWDSAKLKSLSRQELWSLFFEWTEICWEAMADRAYYLDVQPTEAKP